MLLKPTLIYLQRVANIVRSAAGGAFVEGLHIVLFPQNRIAVDETDGERDFRILHPKTGLFGRTQDEQHALAIRQSIPVHQSVFERLRGVSHFNFDIGAADVEIDAS